MLRAAPPAQLALLATNDLKVRTSEAIYERQRRDLLSTMHQQRRQPHGGRALRKPSANATA